MEQIKKIYYLSSTHWDREWYQSFQGFRYRLVNVTNNVIDTLEKDPAFTHFTFDGQTIVLDDYTKIEKGNRDRLIKLIGDGRIFVGPWYVMPDEFLVSGESLIKNLNIGNSLSKEYGATSPMKYGYICDIFGHIAQMPQIFNGCGIKGALLGRGTNDFDTDCHFKWESPNGASCYTFKVPESCGYGSFWYDVWFRYFINEDNDKNVLVKYAIEYVEKELKRSNIPYVVLMDGMDHESIHPDAPWLADELSKHFSCPVVFESLDNMAAEIEREFSESIQTIKGELNSVAREMAEHNMLITHTLSSRYDVKKANDDCQTLVEKWAEPISAMSRHTKNIDKSSFLHEASRQLIKCHAHDSICGCSLDAVHKDMHYRFRQSSAILNEVVADLIGKECGDENVKADSYIISVFNPLPFTRKEVIMAEIDFDDDFSYTFFEQSSNQIKNGFILTDCENNEIEYQLLDIKNKTYCRKHNSVRTVLKNRYTIAFETEMPAFSKTELKLSPANKPVRFLGSLRTDFNKAENESIALTVNDNGTIDILDKPTQKRYSELIYYIDDAEIGDGWFSLSPVNNKSISSRGFAHSISVVEDGKEKVSFEVVTEMQLPKDCNYNQNRILRHEETCEMRIVSVITLAKTGRYVDVKTSIDNTVKDHRIKVLFPTYTDSDDYYANQPFCFVKRQVGIDTTTSDWKEHEKVEKSFESIFYRKDSYENGIAIISKSGLHEVSAYKDEKSTMGVTLFRSFSKTHGTDGEIDGQLLQNLTFEYRIVPIDKSVRNSDLMKIKDSYQTKERVLSYRSAESLSVGKSFIEVTGESIVVSVIKASNSGEGVIVRVSNYADTDTLCTISCGFEIKKAGEVNLLEEYMTDLKHGVNSVEVMLKGNEIKTIWLS